MTVTLYENDFDPPGVTESDDQIARGAGGRIDLDADGTCKGWRLWIASDGDGLPESYLLWQLWNEDTTTLLAQVDVAALSPALGDWAEGTSADFDTPGDVEMTTGVNYIVCKQTLGDPANWSYTVGGGTFSQNGINHLTGMYRGSGSSNQIPNSVEDAKFFADIVMDFGGAVSAAGTASAVALSTASARKTVIDLSTSSAAAGATAVVSKGAVSQCTGPVVAGLTAAASKSVALTAAVLAIPGASVVATHSVPLSATASAFPLASAAVARHVSISAICSAFPGARASVGAATVLASSSAAVGPSASSTGSVAAPNTSAGAVGAVASSASSVTGG